MLQRPIPKGKINKLSEVMLSRDFNKIKAQLQGAYDVFSRMAADDASVPEARKQIATLEALASYIDRPESNLDGQTAFHLCGHLPMDTELDLKAMLFLLKYKANPNAQDNNGNTLMHHYASECVEMIETYLRLQILKQDKTDTLPEVRSLADMFNKRMSTLAFYGGNPNLANKKGETPVSILTHNGKGLEVCILKCYELGKSRQVSIDEIQFEVPKEFAIPHKEGSHAAKVVESKCADSNNNQRKASSCVIL